MRCIFSMLLLTLTMLLQAQAPYRFSQIFLNDGLSDSRVNDITQDKYGFMWFGTANGLNRFDGYSIKTYHASNGANGLPSNYINCLYSSQNGELWVGTSGGLVRYNFLDDKFSPVETKDPESELLKKTQINDIIEDEQGNMYIACFSGILRYAPGENRWENLRKKSKANAGLRQTRRLTFFSDDLLLATTSGGVPMFTYNISTDVLDSIQLLMNGNQCCYNLYDIEKLNEEEAIAGFLSYGIVKINIKHKTSSTVPGALSRNDSILYNSVYDIHKDSRGRIWLASFYYRLAEYLPAENRVQIFEADPYNPYGFKGNSATCVFEDKRKNIWTGTFGNGIFHFNPQNNAVQFYAGNDFKSDALQQGAVRSITEIDSNRLLIGTENGPSIYRVNTNKHQNFKGLSINGINAALEYVQTGLVDKDGEHVWIGTNRLGLSKYNLKTGAFKNYSRVSKPYPLEDDGIIELLQLEDGKIFQIGWNRAGIFDPNTDFYRSFRNDTNAVFALNGIISTCLDGDKKIWLGTNRGNLFMYNQFTKKLVDQTGRISSIENINRIYTIANQADQLYLSTNRGLIILKGNEKPQLFPLQQNDKGGGDFTGILPDKNYVWICSNRKLGRLDTKTGEIILLGEKEGLDNVQLFKKSLIKTLRQTILIGSDQGYFEIFPEKLQSESNASEPVLTDFRVNNRSISMPFLKHEKKIIRLKYDDNFFTFDLSTFDYDEASDIQYAYMLSGFDSEWQYPTDQRTGIYTNVPGGSYSLLLKAKNASGNWVNNTQEIKIIIDRHFSATWWFKLLMTLLAIGIVYWVYKLRMKQVNKEAGLRSDYEIKLNELENSALRTQMNPHFIFNSLNTINSFISLNETEQAHKYIAKFSRLIRYILEHSRQRKILLSDELEVLKLYIEIEQVRFQNKFQYSIHVDESIDTTTVELPPLIIQPFVENAILHGLLPLETNGMLTIEIKHVQDMLHCIVMDNGVGRKRAAALKPPHASLHKSHGIDITMKRIRLFNKAHSKTAQVSITDLTPGTRVEIPVSWEESY